MLLIPVLALFLSVSQAQRPSNASICDYYAAARFGANNSATQFQLVQGIVTLAFGGNFNLSNVSSDITGILNPGNFSGLQVDLRPWFNGSLASTNLNNQPVGLNWLDGGGLDPLYAYLSGLTSDLILSNSTNEYRLFNGFFFAFARLFGCTVPPKPPTQSGGPLSLAYVHKFMNLNTDLGHFINQLTKATTHYGFSTSDSSAMSNQLNSLYNVRCAPAISLSPGSTPQLLSLCQDPSCPLAQPNADCASYVNLTANGVGSVSTSPSASGSLVPPSSVSSSPTSSPTASAAQSSAASSSAAASSGGPSLSSGAIAGIAVGGAAGLALVAGALYFCLRRRRKPAPVPLPAPTYHQYPASTIHSSPTSPYSSPQMTEANTHYSYMSTEPTIAEMESPRNTASPPPKNHGPIYEMGSPDPNDQVWGRVGSRDPK